jgi:type IX secretion system PorP/SprF family membrane protein
MKALQNILAAALLAAGTLPATAQLAPMGAVYFQNQYLNNPAYAGKEGGLRADGGFRRQWSNLPGAPQTQYLTASLGLKGRSGLGLSLYNDEAGLIRQTRVMGSFAYHLPLNAGESRLSFGLSGGVMDELVDYTRLDGDQGDASVANFNRRETYLDGDFGAAFTSRGLSLQVALPNLKTLVGADRRSNAVVNEAGFFAAGSYKFRFEEAMEGLEVEPKVCFRSVKGYDNIVDVGTNISLAAGKVNVTGMYHSSRSTTIGFGAKCTDYLRLMAVYTSGTAALNGDTNGSFELNLSASLWK